MENDRKSRAWACLVSVYEQVEDEHDGACFDEFVGDLIASVEYGFDPPVDPALKVGPKFTARHRYIEPYPIEPPSPAAEPAPAQDPLPPLPPLPPHKPRSFQVKPAKGNS
jgi:hypothetical protein